MRFFITLGLSFLISTSFIEATEHAGHNHSMTHDESPKKNSIKVILKSIKNEGAKQIVQIQLVFEGTDTPVLLDGLNKVHTQKIHLLIIDESLEDYHHIHPMPTAEKGVYTFEWTPKEGRNYILWADLNPTKTNVQEYVRIPLISSHSTNVQIQKTVLMKSSVDGYTFELSFEGGELKAGHAAVGKILVTDKNGKSAKNLEPVMGAFAHIVGFSSDLQNIVHIHPMGAEPTKDEERGGPELTFHLEPKSVGYIKLFAQVKIDGKELFVPFGMNIS